jgi:drug/metabolite transporter (DMT)-like permease
MLKNKRTRRSLAILLIVLGGLLIFLASELWTGIAFLVLGVLLEAAGIALERGDNP